jgi:phosphoesterase RecJ-like protein
MLITPQVDALRDALASARSILLTGPRAPDGDSIGATLALGRAAAVLGEAEITVAGKANFRYNWMPGASELVLPDQVKPIYDVVIVMDGDKTRLDKEVEVAFKAAEVKILVDHHGSTDPDGYEICVLDSGSPSTCEMVHSMLDHWQVPLNSDIAQMLYTGIIFDTGGFKHSNTQPATHRIAAELLGHGVDQAFITARVLNERSAAGLRLVGSVLSQASFVADGEAVFGAVSLADAERFAIGDGDKGGIIDMLLNTTGVELAALVTERGQGRVSISFRSRTRVDVAALAKSLNPGGGGHIRASGVSLKQPLAEVMAALPGQLESALG